MNITIVGTGYVGLVTGACFAETGNHVTCVDMDQNKIDMLNRAEIPFYEPNLAELVERNIREKRLAFHVDLAFALKTAQVVFICVGTPSLESGAADLSQVFSAVEQVGLSSKSKKLVLAIKSTVPVGTGDTAQQRLEKLGITTLSVVSNPEFLREGSAVQDCLLPDRVVIGTEEPTLAEFFKDLYRPYVRTGNPILIMDRRSAELSKYAGNAFLAMRIAFINEMSRLCEKLGADIRNVREAMGADHRIGMQYLFPSIGFGGSCFPKDVRALRHLMEENDLKPHLMHATLQSNEEQKLNFGARVVQALGGPQKCVGKKVAVWGAAFKAKTDDIRESASLTIMNHLLDAGVKICLHDPEAMANAKKNYGDRIAYAEGTYETLSDADALCVLTEWNQFRFPDFHKMKSMMRTPIVFDGRNLYNAQQMRTFGFDYYAVGKAV